MSRSGWVTRFFFLATLFCVSFEKMQWQLGASIELSDVLTVGFLIAFVGSRIVRRDAWLPRAVYPIILLMGALLLVYLLGYFNMTMGTELSQFAKGMVKFLIHALFLIGAVAYLARRTERFYWRALGFFLGGIVANAVYGVVQLAAAERGYDLNASIVNRITSGSKGINVYGGVEGQNVYRPQALAADPNHLAIIMTIPLLVLTPIYLRMEKENPWKKRLPWVIALLLVVEAATLSRSGVLGLLAGVVVLLFPYARRLFSRAMAVPVGAMAGIVLAAVALRPTFFETVFRARTQTSGSGASAHFQVYDFIPQVLHSHPLLGLGLNGFSVYYEFATGKTNWGPHSFYVALFVETGIVGAIVFFSFLAYVFWRLRVALLVGRALARAGDFASRRVVPLTWGMTAALVGTMAANLFYLTMPYYYFYAFIALILALPVVYARRLREVREGV
jgi:O-antigen ligase/polysaccharide polymerase Wzy-like membrane protein